MAWFGAVAILQYGEPPSAQVRGGDVLTRSEMKGTPQPTANVG
jgi:hypothetical protein